jgi:hypothetical protein
VNVLIFAGTQREAVQYRREHGFSSTEAPIVRDPSWLRGRRTRDVPRVFIGTFWERSDIAALQAALAVSDLMRP